MRGPDRVLAWFVSEGDELPGGSQVLSVTRDPVARLVRIVSSTGAVAVVAHDHPVTVLRRAP